MSLSKSFSILILTISVLGFGSVAFALPYYQQTQGLVPGINDEYYVGTSTPSLFEYKKIFTKDLVISGACTGCGGGVTTALGTTTPWTVGQVAYVVNDSTVSGVSTTTLTASGVLTLSQPISAIGPLASVLTLTGGINGQVLGWLAGAPTWTATSSVAAGTGISISANGSVTTITNTGVLSVGNGAGVTCTGTNPAACSLASIAANSVLGNSSGSAAIPSAVSTTTLFGALGTPGFVLMSDGTRVVWAATSSSVTSAVGGTGAIQFADTTSFNGNQSFVYDVTNHLMGIGSTSPFANLSVQANNGETNRTLFAIGSSTASATTTFFKIDNTGLGTFTNLTGGRATTTDLAITNLTAGRVPYVGTGGNLVNSANLTFSGTDLSAPNGSITAKSNSGFILGVGGGVINNDAGGQLQMTNANGGTYILVDNTNRIVFQANVLGNAKQLLNIARVGVATSTPWAILSVQPDSTNGAAPAFAIGSSTGGTTAIVSNRGFFGLSTTSPWAYLSINPLGNRGEAPSFSIGSTSGQIMTVYNTGATLHITPTPVSNAWTLGTSTAGVAFRFDTLNTVLNMASSSPTTSTNGDFWHDLTQKTLAFFDNGNGVKVVLPGVMFTQTADKVVTNTTVETDAVGTGVGTITLPANWCAVGKTLRLHGEGRYALPLTGGSITIKLQYVTNSGTTTIASVTTTGLLTNATDQWFKFDSNTTARTCGASGTVVSGGQATYEGPAAANSVMDDIGATAPVTLDTTLAAKLVPTLTWDTSATTKIATTTIATYEILN